MAFYPVNLNISGRSCLVVGGGVVAARKIESLLFSEAHVRVVSPEVCGRISALTVDGRIEWHKREYRESDLENIFLVFAATNQPDIQEQIALQADKSGVLLNIVDNPGRCDFQVPALVRRGDLLISVSTGGASPALSARIKRQLYLDFGPEYGLLVRLMTRLRSHVVGPDGESEANRELFGNILDLPLLEMITEEKWADLQRGLETILPEEVDCASVITELKSITG